MERIKFGNYLFVFFSSLIVGLMIYSSDWFYKNVGRNLATAEYFSDKGRSCAVSLKRITVPDQKLIEEAFKTCLSSYIQIKTISPVGEEEIAVEFFENIFSELDIAYKSFDVKDLTGINDKRRNLIATLPIDRSSHYDWSTKKENESIILVNHMDVVDVHPEQWERPEFAFGGIIAGSQREPEKDFIWGRGALDMKGIAITQLISMWLLKQSNVKLSRDIHFLAVADEEQSGSGAIGTMQAMREGRALHALSNTSLILNEGGGGMKSLPSDKWNLFLIAVEEKGGAWLSLKNNSYESLISNLSQSQILDLNSYLDKRVLKRIGPKKTIKAKTKKKVIKITGHDCKVIEVITPKPKVNVVTSKVLAKFECREGFQGARLFENVFAKNFDTVSVNAKQNENIIDVTIQTNSSSHGSVGLNESALSALVLGTHYLDIIDLRKYKRVKPYFKYYQTKATKDFLKELSRSNFFLRIARGIDFIPAIRKLVLKTVEGEFGVDGLFRTTCQFSALNFSKSKAEALVDCRLLHTAIKYPKSKVHAEDFKAELIKTIKDENLNIEILDGWNVSQSTTKSRDYKTIVKTLKSYSKKENKKIMAVPYLFPAGTDSTWFRNPFSANIKGVKAIPSYGFFPAYINPELLATFHGANERFPVDEIYPTVDKYFVVLKELSLEKKQKWIDKIKKKAATLNGEDE